jgi:hypothetical protein
MSAMGTVRKTGKQQLAGVKSGELVTEAQAARAMKVSRRRLLVLIRTGWLFSCWAQGHRYVMLP